MKKRLLLPAFLLVLFSTKVHSQLIFTTKNHLLSILENNATISGHVYHDVNGNGIQNLGEPNLANVGVLINQSDGSFQVVDTNVNGDWSALVTPGNTIVSLDQTDLPPISGRIQTEGTNPNSVSAVSFTNTYAGTDGFFYVGTAKGHLYFDKNGNGIQNNPVEPNMPNVTVNVTDYYGNIYNVVTDANGDWTAVVGTGNATANINTSDPDFPTGATQTEGVNPSMVNVILAQTTFSDNDGFYEKGTATGHLYFDYNNNGVQDVDESNMPNVTINIVDNYGNNYTVTTDANGNWTISLPIGTATITINTLLGGFPLGAVQTQGSNPTTITITNNNNTFSGNNGFYNKGTIRGHLYFDLDNNGIQNGTEPNMPNILVNVVDSQGNSQNITTDVFGNWQAIIFPGNAISTIDVSDTDFPVGAIQTQGTNPQTSIVLINQITNTVNCGFFLPSDTDGDGVFDYVESANGTGVNNPCDPSQPIGYNGYNPLNTIWQNSDCDGDGIANGLEHTNGTDPYNPCSPLPVSTSTNYNPSNSIWATADCDSDGISNGQEITLGTNPYSNDTDGDGALDGVEVSNGTNPLDPCNPVRNIGYTGYVNTNTIWQNSDCDGDGIINGNEYTSGTDPYNPCSPLPNANNTNYDSTNTTWMNSDCDNDTINNGQEVVLGTNPFSNDTDGDGILDGAEITAGTSPLNPCDPENNSGYTGYDPTNTIWQNEDCDGDGVNNGLENTNSTDPYDPCSPQQSSNYTGYDPSNPVWQNADCDNDGVPNGEEHINGSNPYDSGDDGLVIFNGISSNTDGKNDYFFIRGIDNYPKNSLSVFNRWGVEVFNTQNYQNDFCCYSRGRITINENERLPSGTYYYKFEFVKPNGEVKNINGYLYIN